MPRRISPNSVVLTMIFKLQLPIVPRDADILIYNEERTYKGFVPQTEELVNLFGDKVKIYAEGEIDKETGVAVLFSLAEEQEW